MPDTAITASSRQGSFRENVWADRQPQWKEEKRAGRAWGGRVDVGPRGCGPCVVAGHGCVPVHGGPCVVLPCAAAVRECMPERAWRLNGKAVRSHSGERTACRCFSGALRQSLLPLETLINSVWRPCVAFFETVEDGRVHSCFKKDRALPNEITARFQDLFTQCFPLKKVRCSQGNLNC